jgi:hypothetical protein
MAQVVDSLPSKPETLNSNTSTTKKNLGSWLLLVIAFLLAESPGSTGHHITRNREYTAILVAILYFAFSTGA